MLTSRDVKTAAADLGADLVGIGDLKRFDGTPAQHDPRHIFPRAEAIIGLGFRVLRGSLRGTEQGTHFYQFPEMGVVHIDEVYAPMVLRRLACFLEDNGYEGVVQRTVPDRRAADDPGTNPERGSVHRIRFARAVKPGRPAPDVCLDFRQAAVVCGLGEIGFGGFLLTPQFGPLQRVAFVLTDAPLDPDPIPEPTLCDRCGACVRACPGNALDAEHVATVRAGERTYTAAALDEWQCAAYYAGAKPASNPFLDPGAYDNLPDGDEIAAGGKRVTPEDLERLTPILRAAYPGVRFGYSPAICGRSCWRACLAHLEEQGRIYSHFKAPFRQEPPWTLP